MTLGFDKDLTFFERFSISWPFQKKKNTIVRPWASSLQVYNLRCRPSSLSAESLGDKPKGMTDIRASKSVEQNGKECVQEKKCRCEILWPPSFFLVCEGSEKKTHTKLAVWNPLLIKTR